MAYSFMKFSDLRRLLSSVFNASTGHDHDGVNSAKVALAQGSVLIGDASGDAVALNAKGDGKILVGNGTTATSVSVSGDATLSNAGVLSIGSNKITKAMLSAAVSMNLKVVGAGIFTTEGGDANESIPLSGALGTDTALVWVQKAGASPATVDTITPGTDAIAVVMSGNPSTDHKLCYLVLRAVA
jgi:hypothetical protein